MGAVTRMQRSREFAAVVANRPLLHAPAAHTES
jgi:hypothetical protein